MTLRPPCTYEGEHGRDELKRDLAHTYMPDQPFNITHYVYAQAHMVACGRGIPAVIEAYESLAIIARQRACHCQRKVEPHE